MNAGRMLLGAVSLLALGWLAFELAGGGGAPDPGAARTFTSSRQCQECHAEVYAEWQASWHAQSWTDPEVRRLSNDFQNSDCIDCHAPLPVLETGIGNRVLPRTTRRVEGVDCIACHLLPEGAGGTVAGTRTAPAAPCRPEATPALADPAFCGACHDQHGTVQQWRATPFARPGPGFRSCVDCHMPHRGGDPRRGRDHTMHGGHDIALVRTAVTLRGAREEGVWVAEVENHGAGHNFPTDERSRAADVFWRPRDESDWRHAYRFRNPYRFEVGLEDTELPHGATQRIPLPDAGAGPIEVALFYKLTPLWSDPERPDPEREAELVHKIVLSP
jgi:hypothetical protein